MRNIFKQSYDYISIIFYGLTCTIAYNFLASVSRALGDSKTPLIFLIISSVLNVILDLTMIINFHMGVQGAALATCDCSRCFSYFMFYLWLIAFMFYFIILCYG